MPCSCRIRRSIAWVCLLVFSVGCVSRPSQKVIIERSLFNSSLMSLNPAFVKQARTFLLKGSLAGRKPILSGFERIMSGPVNGSILAVSGL